MKEYIEREALFTYLEKRLAKYPTIIGFLFPRIADVPTADVAPVVHGEWIDKCVRDWHCSLCDCEIQKVRKVDGYCYDDLPNYCPECGAKMSGGNK